MNVLHAWVPLETAALREQLAAWQANYPRVGVLALVPEAEAAAVPMLQEACRGLMLPLVGGVFPALIHDGGFVTAGVQLIGFSVMPPWFLQGQLNEPQAGERLAANVRKLFEQARAVDAQASSLFLVFDGMLPHIGTLLEGLSADMGQWPLQCSGVNAGSETFQPMPCLFDAYRLLDEAVLAWVLPTGTQVVARHDYPVSQALLMATSTSGNRIDTIDHRPAFDVYREVIEKEYGVQVTAENFYDLSVHFPFGLVTVVDVLVRIPVAVELDTGALLCVGEIPPHSPLRLLRAPDLAASQCVDSLVRELRPAAVRQGLLTFYCAGRRMHFAGEAEQELVALQQQAGSDALCGALTLGEIDSMETSYIHNLPRFHNACILCVA